MVLRGVPLMSVYLCMYIYIYTRTQAMKRGHTFAGGETLFIVQLALNGSKLVILLKRKGTPLSCQ